MKTHAQSWGSWLAVSCALAWLNPAASAITLQAERDQGTLSWTNDTPDAYYQVEWAHRLDLAESWQQDYTPLLDIQSTNPVIQVDVPRFFRVISRDQPVGMLVSPDTSQMASGYYQAANLRTIDPDLSPTNIPSGVTLFGVEGTLEIASAPKVSTNGAKQGHVPVYDSNAGVFVPKTRFPSKVFVSDYGEDDAALSACLADVGSNETHLVLGRRYAVSGESELPGSITLECPPGTGFDLSDTNDFLLVNGPILAGPKQRLVWFDDPAGAGLYPRGNQDLSVCWWGVVIDDENQGGWNNDVLDWAFNAFSSRGWAGTFRLIKHGAVFLDRTLNLPKGISLIGGYEEYGNNALGVHALIPSPAFDSPTDYLVSIKEDEDYSSCRISGVKFLLFDRCNGVYANAINERSGLQNCLISRPYQIGVYIESNFAQNWTLEGLDIITTYRKISGPLTGLYIARNASTRATLRDITLNFNDSGYQMTTAAAANNSCPQLSDNDYGPNTQGVVGVMVTGNQGNLHLKIEDFHAEDVNIGILHKGNAGLVVDHAAFGHSCECGIMAAAVAKQPRPGYLMVQSLWTAKSRLMLTNEVTGFAYTTDTSESSQFLPRYTWVPDAAWEDYLLPSGPSPSHAAPVAFPHLKDQTYRDGTYAVTVRLHSNRLVYTWTDGSTSNTTYQVLDGSP